MAQGTHRAPRRCHHYDRWRPIEWNQPWPGNTQDLITNRHRQGNNKVQSQESWPFLGIGKPKELFRYIWNLTISDSCVLYLRSPVVQCKSWNSTGSSWIFMDFRGERWISDVLMCTVRTRQQNQNLSFDLHVSWSCMLSAITHFCSVNQNHGQNIKSKTHAPVPRSATGNMQK